MSAGSHLGCRAAMPPGGRRGDPVTKRRNLVWSAGSSSDSTVRKCRTAVLLEVYLQQGVQGQSVTAVALLQSPLKKDPEPLSCSLHSTDPDSTELGSTNCKFSLSLLPDGCNEDKSMVMRLEMPLDLAQLQLVCRCNGYQMQPCRGDSNC